MKKLEGKVAVITGGSSGIGLATAKLFASEGAQLVITGRRADVLERAALDVGHDTVSIQGDVSDLSHHDAVVSQVQDMFGQADIYIANAGMNVLKPYSGVSLDDYEQHFGANTRGVFFGVQKMLTAMQDGGNVLLTGSLAASKVLDNHALYAGTKAAVTAFAKNLAVELKDRRIRVNVISPGPVDTEIISKLGITEEQKPAFLAAMAEAIPAGRIGQPEEIARAALFLASDDASFVNGVELLVDGGMALR